MFLFKISRVQNGDRNTDIQQNKTAEEAILFKKNFIPTVVENH